MARSAHVLHHPLRRRRLLDSFETLNQLSLSWGGPIDSVRHVRAERLPAYELRRYLTAKSTRQLD